MNRPVSIDAKSECHMSACGRYRHYLKRSWGAGIRLVNFCMVNPSTARLEVNDPTVYGNEVRARLWGFDGYIISNLFDWRATFPEEMERVEAPSSPQNDRFIRQAAGEAELVVCAWGNHGMHRNRAEEVLHGALSGFELHYLKLNKNGQPAHPLYLGYELRPMLWERQAVASIAEGA